MKVGCLHTLDDMSALHSEMNELNLRSPVPDPFSTFEFYRSILNREVMGGSKRAFEPWFLVAFEDGVLIGYMALKQTTTGSWWPMRRLDFLVEHDGDRPHVVAEAGKVAAVAASFYRYLHECRQEWDYLELQQQDSESILGSLAPTLLVKGCRVRRWSNMDNCTIYFRWDSPEGYCEALAAKFRTNVRRQLGKLLASGNVEWLASSDPASTPALFEMYCSVEMRSWKAGTDLGVCGQPGTLEYWRRLLDAGNPMAISIQILLLDGVPIAGMINGSFQAGADKGLYALHLAFDRQLGQVAPGSAILLLGVRHAILGRYRFLNLLSGFGHYKSRWLAQQTSTWSVQVYRVGSLHYLHRLAGDALRSLKACILSPVQRLSPARPRRAAEDSPREVPFRAYHADITRIERLRHDELLARVRRGHYEQLSARDIADFMSLPYGRAAQQRAAPEMPVSRPAQPPLQVV